MSVGNNHFSPYYDPDYIFTCNYDQIDESQGLEFNLFLSSISYVSCLNFESQLNNITFSIRNKDKDP